MEPASKNTVRPTSPRKNAAPPHSTTGASAVLAPSPNFRERNVDWNDDSGAAGTPSQAPLTPQPRRSDLHTRGLSLQLPPRWSGDALSSIVPLSPKLQTDTQMQSPNILSRSPATSLPRHSRGLDFSRASTNLHHSTLPDHSSPDCSPIVSQKGIGIPRRRMSVSSLTLDSPYFMGSNSAAWTTIAPERSVLSSSVGSVNMLASESESSDSDDASMGVDDSEDPVFTTPQVHKLNNPSAPTPFNAPVTPRGTATWGSGSHFSPAQASLTKTIRRTRLQRKAFRASKKSSSSASGSGYSSMASPRTASPPPLRSIESATNNGGYFMWAPPARSRRESLALGTDGLHISSGNDSGDEGSHTTPSTPGVVRRPVTRRGNLLPKTKGFARIRAALAEEAAPVETELQREAETIRQVRERDPSGLDTDLSADRPPTATAASSPTLLPAVAEASQEDLERDLDSESIENKGLGVSFAAHAHRNSGGPGFWNRLEFPAQTPPPPFFRQSSGNTSDTYMDSPVASDLAHWRRPRTRSSVSEASDAVFPTSSSAVPAGMNDDMHLKKFKRRREDDFDLATIKRRAVSPGVSAQNSPVLVHSPLLRGSDWGQPPERKDTKDIPPLSAESSAPSSSHSYSQPARSGSGGSTMSISSAGTIGPGNKVNQGKKLGLQPMADTHDGLMKMSIE